MQNSFCCIDPLGINRNLISFNIFLLVFLNQMTDRFLDSSIVCTSLTNHLIIFQLSCILCIFTIIRIFLFCPTSWLGVWTWGCLVSWRSCISINYLHTDQSLGMLLSSHVCGLSYHAWGGPFQLVWALSWVPSGPLGWGTHGPTWDGRSLIFGREENCLKSSRLNDGSDQFKAPNSLACELYGDINPNKG